jgi:glutamate dehydrogenase
MRNRALDICATWQQTAPPVAAAELQEASDFLTWLTDNHFTFLGSQHFRLRRGSKTDVLEPVPGTALGVMKSGSSKVAHAVQLQGELREQARLPQLLLITKSSTLSRVHRAAHLDHISIKQLDRRGNVIGETRFLGLFTSSAYTMNPRHIPLLRHKLQRVLAAIGYSPDSHDGKSVQP